MPGLRQSPLGYPQGCTSMSLADARKAPAATPIGTGRGTTQTAETISTACLGPCRCYPTFSHTSAR